ncbi:MAG: RHS repeat-associated core domain-containing protein, partial [Planctomycetota bacterium]
MAFEIDATPGSANAGKVTRGYFHGPGLNEVLAVDQFAGGEAKTVWQFADHAGTVETVGTHTHSGGWRLLHRSVDEVGRTDVPFAGTTDVTLGETGDAWLKAVPAVFAGHRLDETTGLWETPDRWYDAQTQRHLSEDPLGDGTNLYAFADGDPVNPGGVSAASTPRLSEWLEEAGDYFEDQGAIPISIASHTLSAVATLFDGTVADSIRGEAAASRESITRAMADGGVLGGLGGYAALGLNYAGEALAQYGLMAGAAGVAAPPALLAGHAAIGATPAWAAPWVVNPYTAGAARTFGAALGAYQTVTSGADAYRHYQSGVLSGSDFAFVSAGLAGTYASATTRLL